MQDLFRRKSLESLIRAGANSPLKRVLGKWGLTSFGIGSIIGSGIFVLTGTAAATHAGPAIMLSFVVAAIACGFAGLCYAELASMIPVAGSAYTYAYATLGELIAWIIGWDLLLEYAIGNSAVAVSWGEHLAKILEGFGIVIPHMFLAGPWHDVPGIINVPAAAICFVVSWLLVRGVKESTQANNFFVVLKLIVIVMFIVLGSFWVAPTNWVPFFPFGQRGILTGAGLVFFAYIGFDAVSTATEEAINPAKDVPFGILMSLAVCTILYIAVAAVMTGLVPYHMLNNATPMATALEVTGQHWAKALYLVGATAGLTSVLLVFSLGQTRILYTMARDGLLPRFMSRVHPKYSTPHINTWVVGAITAVGAGLFKIDILAEMCNIGTLFAFVLVCVGVLVLRARSPEAIRGFRCPGVPAVPIAGIVMCSVLIYNESYATQLRFLVWLVVGLVVYFAYSRSRSVLGTGKTIEGPDLPSH
ncbi:MAG: amino acid permease [Candidatus Sericytochromatia bacterium]|nr:amino acid permease [Candidatus Sericytochromatia bacterium]